MRDGGALPDRAVVVAARRTPIATVGQRLSDVDVATLAATAVRAVLADVEAAVGDMPVADVIVGNCMGPGGNPARVAALAAGLPVSVPGMTIDRQCGSGLAAIIIGAHGLDGEHVLIAGGAESASTAPTRIAHDAESDAGYARAPFAPFGHADPDMGPAAQELGRVARISRTRQDAYAARSHERALSAVAAGRFNAELISVAGVESDDGPRRMTTAVLARFPPAFVGASARGYQGDAGVSGDDLARTVTAGNSCRVSDGAALVALVRETRRRGAPGLALVSSATVGCDPALPGLGPVEAVRLAIARAGVTLDDVAAIEIVEAFAAQVLAVTDQLGLSAGDHVDERVCSDGGALALGHPWGASGAIGVVRLFSRLVTGGAPAGSLGLSTAAIGGGMGVAAVFEVVR